MSTALANELRDAAARLRRVPSRCLKDGHALVDWLRDEARELDRMSKLLTPVQRAAAARAVAPETVFTAGPILVRGKMVRVERRRAR